MAGLAKGVEICPQCEADLRSFNILNQLIISEKESSVKDQATNSKPPKNRPKIVYVAFLCLIVAASFFLIQQHNKLKNNAETLLSLRREKEMLNNSLRSKKSENEELLQELEAEHIIKEELRWVTVKIKYGDTFNEIIENIQSDMPVEERKKRIIEKNGISNTDFIIKGESIEIIK